MSLLKKYIKSVLKEVINHDDSLEIEEIIKQVNLVFEAESLSLYSLNFDPKIIAGVRDERVPEWAIGNSTYVAGLGFNPFSSIDKNNNHQIVKDYYDEYGEKLQNKKQHSKLKIKNYRDVAKGALVLKKAADELNLKILGSGLFRVALGIPQVPNIIIKIALSQAGRDDNLNEINFSLGQGAKNIRHKENFSNVYLHDKNGAWLVIDKEKMFTETIRNENEIFDNLKNNQFKNTFSLFEKLGITGLYRSIGRSEKMLFAEYLQFIFKFDENELYDLHKEIIEKKYENDEKYKKIFRKVKGLFFGKAYEKDTDYIKMSDDYFKKKLFYFFARAIYDFVYQDQQKIKALITKIEQCKSSTFREFSRELGMLFDQATTSGIRDMHIGNLGVKQNQDGNYRLIFTDIDSGTYKLQ